jgi:phage terminase large subunit-like protein
VEKLDNVKMSRAYRYAHHCAEDTAGEVGRYVKAQAQKWVEIADGKSDTAVIDMKTYRKIDALLGIMIHPDVRKPMRDALEPYAMWIITAVFCTKRKDNGLRLYDTVLLEIARKNFKTFVSAVIFILAMLLGKPFLRSFSVAPDYDLSTELRLAVAKIIKSSPELVENYRIMRDSIKCKINDSEYTPLAYSNDRMDGRLADVFLADEAGAMDSYPVEAMRSSQITLEEPLGIIISTQYPNDNNVLTDEIDIAKKALDGLVGRDNIFALLYEPDGELIKDWMTDIRVIWQANPVSLTMPRMMESILQKRETAILYENKRENFLCKHLNIKYKGLGVEGYVDINHVRECMCEEDSEWWKGRDVWLGLDLSQTDDNTSVAMVAVADGNIRAKVWGFVPEERIELKSAREQVDYRSLIREGCCYGCGDSIIDYGFVEGYILDIEKKFGVNVVSLGFDRWNALSSVQKLESAEDPIECVEVRMHSSVLHPPTKLLYEQIETGAFRYERNRLLEINFQNARCTEDTNKNKYVNKKKSTGKVDMVVSLIIAIRLAMDDAILGDAAWVVQT